MKKIIVTLSIACFMVCSLATLCSASHTEIASGFGNRYNGSYYYDIGWSKVNVKGANCKTSVVVYLKKNGDWQGRNQTFISGTSNSAGNTVTCYSQKLQGKGATNVASIIVDLK